jgi:hypothetical protein
MRRSRALGVVFAGALLAGGAVYALRPPAALAEANEPLPSPAGETSVNRDGSMHHRLELVAHVVDIAHLGAHTHANWVVFELPFDSTDPTVRRVRFSARTTTDAAIGALHTRFGCVRVPPTNPRAWAHFTQNGVGHTHDFDEHELAPTHSPRGYAINVPTRLANAAACWRPSLARRETWRLLVEWDST